MQTCCRRRIIDLDDYHDGFLDDDNDDEDEDDDDENVLVCILSILKDANLLQEKNLEGDEAAPKLAPPVDNDDDHEDDDDDENIVMIFL